MAFEDNTPQAPVHVVVIPKVHVGTALEMTPDREPLLSGMWRAALVVARLKHVAENGFRLVVNCGAAAGQTVFHIHMHVMGGRSMGWPPG